MNINKQTHSMRGGTVAGLARKLAAFLALALVAAASCDDDEVAATDVATDDAYLYDAYYPADLGYSGYYAADSWDYGVYGFSLTGAVSAQTATGAGGNTGTGGATGTTTPLAGIGTAIRALVRGETVCPGQVTVTPKTAAPACAGSNAATVRNGITIVFAGCQLSGGGTIDGTFDVVSTRTASEQTCSATTTVSLGHTTTITNLTYTDPSGAKVVIPSQTDNGTTSYTFGQTPTTFTISTNGELQLFNSAGTMLSDHTHSGSRTYTFAAGGQSYSFDGTLSVQDQRAAGAATLTATGVARNASCCRPTAGSLGINYTSGALAGKQHAWTFGSSCGAAQRDGKTVTLPACI